MTKELCECGNLAIWAYLPSASQDYHPYYCDDCVPRGCMCQYRYIDESESPDGDENKDWIWIEKDVCWVDLDEKQREYPCAEFDWEPGGYEREINPHIIKQN
jgi:hypothetical protein